MLTIVKVRRMATAAQEAVGIAVIGGILLLFFFIPALLTARAEVRDDLRRTDITNLKHAAEQYFNLHEYYPTPPTDSSPCTSSGADSWLFGEQSLFFHDRHIDVIPHDLRESRGHVYTYCVTSTDVADHTDGYFLQAVLERPQPERRAFDEDEDRKFHYRVLHDGERVLYRVCGGREKQCEPTLNL